MSSAASPSEQTLLAGVFAPGWDHSRDVLVVVGRSGAGFYDALLAAGQARVVEIAPSDSLDPPPPPPYGRAANAADLFRVVLASPGPAPTNASFRVQPGAHFPAELQLSLTEALRGAVSAHSIYQYSVNLHAPQWAGQGIANLARVAELPPSTSLDGAFAGKPCVIVSPGPSLMRNVDLLSEFVGKAVIMTCSHALHSLDAAGVVPDFVAVADPKFSDIHFAGYDTSAPAAFVLDAAAHPGNYALDAQRIFTFSTHQTVDEWIFGALSESAFLDSGGSVACVELSLAQRMGCDPIVFIGQDLAFSDGRYYAESSVDGGVSALVNASGDGLEVLRPSHDRETGEPIVVEHPVEPMIQVPGWGGGTATSSASLNTFLQWFQVAAQSASCRIYNCTEGGAHIDGMEHISLREFLDGHEFEPLDVASVLDRAAAAVDVSTRREAMRTAVIEMLAGLEDCVEEARKCGRLAGRAARDAGALEKLGHAEGRLSKAIGPLPFLSMLSQSRIRAAQERGQQADTLEENLAAAQQIFGVVQEAGRTLVAPLREALSALSE